MLNVEGINTHYGAVHAIKDVSIQVQKGEIVTIIGANGAGKSTLMNSICGVCKPRTGRIVYEGQDIQNMPTHDVMRLGLSQSPEGRRVFPRMSVTENLILGAHRCQMPIIKERMSKQFALFPRLKERMDQRAGTMSGGEQQMLAIARALMSEPRLLLLDEPSLGLAPLIVKDIFSAIVQINKQQGTAVLLVEQNAYQALKIAHRGYVLVNGRIDLSGSAQDLLSNPAIRSAYLEGGH